MFFQEFVWLIEEFECLLRSLCGLLWRLDELLRRFDGLYWSLGGFLGVVMLYGYLKSLNVFEEFLWFFRSLDGLLRV